MTRSRAGSYCGGGQGPLNTVQLEHPSHTGALLYGLNTLRSKGLLLDVTLIAGGQEFRAHRVVLASCSEYFRAMFTDEMKERCQSEISLKGVSATGLHHLLEYAYTSRLCLNLANILDILAAAAHFQVPTIIQACSNYLQAQLDLDNCVDVSMLAETYSLYSLRKKVTAFMSAHLHQFSQTADFQRLNASQLTHLLSCDFPVDCSEAQVLDIVLDWLQYDWNKRAAHCPTLLSSINWNEVPKALIQKVERLITGLSSPQLRLSSLEMPLSPSTPQGLVNTRGLELAVVKVGGFSLCGVTNEITYFLPSSGRWRHLTTIPHVEQCNFGTAVLENELFVVGGCFNQSLEELIHPFGFRFSPQHNKWSTMAPMQRERCRFSLSVVRGFLYAVGGSSESPYDHGDESPCEAYDPASDSWSPIPSLPGFRAQHSAATLGHRLLITGGLEGERVLDSCYVYDTTTNSWSARSPLLKPRADHASVTYGGHVYVCGGWYEDEIATRVLVGTIDRYDLETDTWTVVTNVPTPRFHAGVVVVDNLLWVVGGCLSDVPFDRGTGVVEVFDFRTGEWQSCSSYPQDIWEHVCVPLYVPRCRDDMDVLPFTE
ncbi:UNVERIFIED_CONTAM: hypothetical protein RMT77_016559 [Armadillidium vulgare]